MSRYGIPRGIRVDQGTEFRGEFSKYCDSLGIRRQVIFTFHPQANGQVERINGLIRQGIRKMATAMQGGAWVDGLPLILAGLRFLPNYLGHTPAVLVFK